MKLFLVLFLLSSIDLKADQTLVNLFEKAPAEEISFHDRRLFQINEQYILRNGKLKKRNGHTKILEIGKFQDAERKFFVEKLSSPYCKLYVKTLSVYNLGNAPEHGEKFNHELSTYLPYCHGKKIYLDPNHRMSLVFDVDNKKSEIRFSHVTGKKGKTLEIKMLKDQHKRQILMTKESNPKTDFVIYSIYKGSYFLSAESAARTLSEKKE